MDPAAPYSVDVSGNLLVPRRPAAQSGTPSHRHAKVCRRQRRTHARYDETFTLTFGDRPAYVGFAGGGIILPRAEADGIAIETVNVSKLKIEVLRVPDRILSQYEIRQGSQNDEGGYGNWEFNDAGSNVGVRVYQGEINIDTRNRRNIAITTVFALGSALHELRPGAYIVKVRDGSPGAGQRAGRRDEEDSDTDSPASAFRWILYTDMALQSFSGATGMDVIVRSLRTARPMAGVTMTLIAQNNEELARARTDGNGRVHFDDALIHGDGPAQARYVMAYGAQGDFAAQDLQRPALDLSDRGIDGRHTPGNIDAYRLHRARRLSPRRNRALDRPYPRSDRARHRRPAFDACRLSSQRHRSAAHSHGAGRQWRRHRQEHRRSIAARRVDNGAPN